MPATGFFLLPVGQTFLSAESQLQASKAGKQTSEEACGFAAATPPW